MQTKTLHAVAFWTQTPLPMLVLPLILRWICPFGHMCPIQLWSWREAIVDWPRQPGLPTQLAPRRHKTIPLLMQASCNASITSGWGTGRVNQDSTSIFSSGCRLSQQENGTFCACYTLILTKLRAWKTERSFSKLWQEMCVLYRARRCVHGTRVGGMVRLRHLILSSFSVSLALGSFEYDCIGTQTLLSVHFQTAV